MIRNKIQDITTDPMDTKRMIVCCKQLHAHKFDNPDEKVQFLETHYLSISVKEEVGSQTVLSIQEIKPLINILQNRKYQSHLQTLLSI